MKAPSCKKCKKEVVLADAGVLTSKPYWYCRVCKIEVDDAGYAFNPNDPKKDLDNYFADEISRLDLEAPALGLQDDEEDSRLINPFPFTFTM